jgi:hypothetical protein
MDAPTAGDRMKTARSAKLIKRANRKDRRMPIAVKSTPNRNRWSTAVRSWIVDFKDRDRSESLPAFDSLFKDGSPSPDAGTESSSS